MTRIEPLESPHLRQALGYVLATAGGRLRSDHRQVIAFCDYLDQCPVQWDGLRCGPPESPSGLFFALRLPGETAIVMIPNPGEAGIDPGDQLRVTTAGMEALRGRHLHYAQALPEPDAVAKRTVLEQVGFRMMAPLTYLERDVVYPWTEPPQPHEAEWIGYEPGTHADFAAVVLATYEGSLDCPELSGLRPIDDVLAAHQASGPFDPRLWEIPRIDGQQVGCMLLSRLTHGSLLEVVYMGVVPAWRGRGVGDLLLRRALDHCRRVRARRLTLVVDDRNQPAKRMYERFAFASVGRRDALLYRWE